MRERRGTTMFGLSERSQRGLLTLTFTLTLALTLTLKKRFRFIILSKSPPIHVSRLRSQRVEQFNPHWPTAALVILIPEISTRIGIPQCGFRGKVQVQIFARCAAWTEPNLDSLRRMPRRTGIDLDLALCPRVQGQGHRNWKTLTSFFVHFPVSDRNEILQVEKGQRELQTCAIAPYWLLNFLKRSRSKF